MGCLLKRKMNTNMNLARVTLSQSRCRSSNGFGGGGKRWNFEECPNSETSSNEQDRSQVVSEQLFNGDKTYDNRTGEIQTQPKNYI